MRRKISLFLLAIALPTIVKAQHSIYLNRNTSPQMISVASDVDSITYQGQTVMLWREGKATSWDVDSISVMGCKEQDSWRSIVLPEKYHADFDYDIAFDKADEALASRKQPEVTDMESPRYEDFVEHSSWTKRLTITYDDSVVRVEGEVDSVSVTVNGAHVIVNSQAREVEYVLRGNSQNGSFKLYSERKSKLVLDGLCLTNPKGPAINSQSKKHLYLELSGNTRNILTDGPTYTKVSGEDQRGCVFAEGQICISGTGSLTVTGKKKCGIASDKQVHVLSGFIRVNSTYAKGKSLYAKEHITIGGGALHAFAEGNASKAIASDSLITITGGKITAITTGNALWDDDEQDYSSCCGIKSGYDMALLGGDIYVLSSGDGGKGISAGDTLATVAANGTKKVTYYGTLTITDSRIWVRTAGKRVPEVKEEDSKGNKIGASSSPKGIKASGAITINSGEVYVRCSGGNSAEGIESKKTININGGKIRTYCIDDGMNAEGATIKGGDIMICSQENDGFDVSFLYMYGGELYCVGSYGEQMGLDTDGKTFVVNGGKITSIGARNCAPYTRSTQATVLCYLKKNVRYVALINSEGQPIETVLTPDNYKPLSVLISSDKIKVGESYKIVSYEHGLEDVPVVEYEFVPTNTSTSLGSFK